MASARSEDPQAITRPDFVDSVRYRSCCSMLLWRGNLLANRRIRLIYSNLTNGNHPLCFGFDPALPWLLYLNRTSALLSFKLYFWDFDWLEVWNLDPYLNCNIRTKVSDLRNVSRIFISGPLQSWYQSQVVQFGYARVGCMFWKTAHGFQRFESVLKGAKWT